jgi:hypothetical protein
MKFAKKYMLVSVDENGKTPIQKGNGVLRATEFDPGEVSDLRGARQERSDMKDNLRDPNVSLYDKLARHSEHMTKYLEHMENLKKPQQELLSAIRGLSVSTPEHSTTRRVEDPSVAASPPGEYAISSRVSPSIEKDVGYLMESMRSSGFDMGEDGSIRKGTFYAEPTTARKLLVAASTPSSKRTTSIPTTELRRFTTRLRQESVPYARFSSSTRPKLTKLREGKKREKTDTKWRPVWSPAP